MESLLTKDILDLMRQIGDPLVDSKVQDLLKDDSASKKFQRDLGNARRQGLAFLKDRWLTANARTLGVDEFLKPSQTLPDPDLVKTACDLFARYGSEISAALLLAALPEAYAAGEGAKVLFQRSELAAGGAVSTRRILATAQFVIWVLTPGTQSAPVRDKMRKYDYPSFDETVRLWGTGRGQGQALRASLALRIMHSFIRNAPPTGKEPPVPSNPDYVPLNQTDLLATLLSFSITVFEVLEQFGITWSPEEQEAYFYVWDRVGKTLGIGDTSVISELTGTETLKDLRKVLRALDEGDQPTRDGNNISPTPRPGSTIGPAQISGLFDGPINRRVLRRIADIETLRPQSVAEARALLARLRERMWTLKYDSFPERGDFTYENFNVVLNDLSCGRILLKAMVDEVVTHLEPSQGTWPIAVIRQLVPPEVQNRLALGGTSSIGLLGGIFGTPRDTPGAAVLRWGTAEVLRLRATRVANSLFLDYYDKGELEIPGLASTAVRSGVRR